jgi:acyl carrier protein
MTEAELRKTVLDTLGDIAPEADLATLAPGKDFREELDIDSMDFLNFVIACTRSLASTSPSIRGWSPSTAPSHTSVLSSRSRDGVVVLPRGTKA